MTERRLPALAAALMAVTLVAACSDADEGVDGAGGRATSTTAVATTMPSMSTTRPPPVTKPTTSVPPGCDLDEVVPVLDDAIALARLAPGGGWRPDTGDAAFAERTNPPEEFAYRLAFDCAVRVVQRTDSGDERLALAAWNDRRHAYVIQATDAPFTPYAPLVRFQLFLEQPYGEWLEELFVWAGTLSGGESVIVGTRDDSVALTAKSWQAAVPRFEDLPVTLDAERYGIDALVAAGGRAVSVAEPAAVGSEIGSIQFHTPLALPAVAVVAPNGWFDPMVPLLGGASSTHPVDDVVVRLTRGLPTEYDVADVGWPCAGHDWRLYAGFGSPEELLDFATALVRSLDC